MHYRLKSVGLPTYTSEKEFFFVHRKPVFPVIPVGWAFFTSVSRAVRRAMDRTCTVHESVHGTVHGTVHAPYERRAKLAKRPPVLAREGGSTRSAYLEYTRLFLRNRAPAGSASQSLSIEERPKLLKHCKHRSQTGLKLCQSCSKSGAW